MSLSNFNPRFPRGKRPLRYHYLIFSKNFNPRFPRGKRRQSSPPLFLLSVFQSTLPAGEATLTDSKESSAKVNFNPRFPRGKRPFCVMTTDLSLPFQSTLPAGEATQKYHLFLGEPMISIHASRGGSDMKFNSRYSVTGDFNPRFPRGKRPSEFGCLASLSISIHASRGGSDHIRPARFPSA